MGDGHEARQSQVRRGQHPRGANVAIPVFFPEVSGISQHTSTYFRQFLTESPGTLAVRIAVELYIF